MRSCNQSWMTLMAVCLVAACAGCSSETAENGPEKPTNGKATPNGNSRPEVPKNTRLVMSAKDREACLLWVGDTLPEVALRDLQDEEQSLAALRGEKLTVVLFWSSGEKLPAQLKAEEALQDLEYDFFQAYLDKGVRVVGINVGDPPEVIRQRTDVARPTFPILLDGDRAVFSQVATQRLPRVYLLDADGKILWLDQEFSSTSREYLTIEIRIALGEK